MNTLMAAGVYLANKPDGAVLAMLIVALIAFVGAAVVGFLVRTFYATAMAVGLAFFVLAFLLKS